MNLPNLPRFPLATLPTPLEELSRLSSELGVRVLCKRDDLTGFALGGNKARKLEFLVADALAQDAATLVTGGGVQSNHIRITAAAARKAGLDAVAVVFDSPSGESNGNLLLDKILGAELVYAGTSDKNETDRVVRQVTEDLRARGRRPYLIPVGGSTGLGSYSYLLAVGELMEQLRALRVTPHTVFLTTGSCGTHAGVLAGVKYFEADIPVQGITVSRPVAEGRERITRLVAETAELIGRSLALGPGDIVIDDAFLGPAYAEITPEARSAIHMLARLEGLFLDPVYTAKTMAALIDYARRGQIPPGSTVVFWHTGGQPGLFGFPDDVI
jgi:D-cysteine desulfhydrase family pyridoxal phosphate-dependent enzyme